MAKKRIFIGDVHGCATELEDLLAKLKFRPAKHELYFVGDVVNRGPESLKALRLAREVATGAVLGNHELQLIGCAEGTRSVRRSDTLDGILAAKDFNELFDWLYAQPLMRIWKDIVLIHAGISPVWEGPEPTARRLQEALWRPGDPLRKPSLAFATRVRYCDSHGRRAPARLVSQASARCHDGRPGPIAAPYKPWDAFYRSRRRVVFGHWSARGRVVGKRVRGLDTGCVWGGHLTAWIAEEDRFVSVRARKQYL